MTHCNIVALVAECAPLEVNLNQRFVKFSKNIYAYGSSIVKMVADIALTNPLSVYCSNYSHITHSQSKTIHLNYRSWYESVPEELVTNVGVLREMLDVRDGIAVCPHYGIDDVMDLIEVICIG